MKTKFELDASKLNIRDADKLTGEIMLAIECLIEDAGYHLQKRVSVGGDSIMSYIVTE